MTNRFVILDRDGVINLDSAHYIKNPDEWVPIPNSLKAIAKLTQLGYKVIVVTNQSGVARKYFTPEVLEAIHQKMMSEVKQAGGEIADIFICPHGPDDNCDCRKPKTGLYEQIQEKYPEIDLSNTYSVGDSFRDLQAAFEADSLPVLVKTGNGQKTLDNVSTNPLFFSSENKLPVFDDLWGFSTSLEKK